MPSDAAIAGTIHALLDERRVGGSICPSEVARAIEPDDAAAWRALMPQVRQVAAALAREGTLKATRRGVVVDACSPGGPIRLSRP